jgi:hypothetical protein
MHAIGQRRETFSIRVTCSGTISLNGHEAELVMNSRITDYSEQIDRKTSRSICDAVGEQLQRTLRPESSRLSPHLKHLMDELRRRDSEDHLRSSN